MLSKLRLITKYSGAIPSCIRFQDKTFKRNYTMDKVEIVDINIDSMMYDDFYEEHSRPIVNRDAPLQSIDINGVPIAPIDINPWIEEEELKEGTVLEDTIERREVISIVPPPPKERSGIYEFKGIKIVLPKKLLSSATYRYRLDQDDLDHLADDIRICKFDK